MNMISNLSRREQVLVIMATLLACFFIVLQFAVMPVMKGKTAAKAAHAQALRDMDIVRRAVPALDLNTQSKARRTFQRDSVLTAAREAGLSISRLQPGPDGDVQIWFDDAQACGIYSMLSALTRDYAVDIRRADIQRQDGGAVSAQVTLRATS